MKKIRTVFLWVFIYSFGCLFLAPSHNNLKESEQVHLALRVKGGGSGFSEPAPNITTNTMSNQVAEKIQLQALQKYFPDRPERIYYQDKQEKNYKSARKKIDQANKTRVKFKLTTQEQDALDYFNGENFYSHYQSVETQPNIFDTRLSFLLKVQKNQKMREDFLKAYKQRQSVN